MPGEYGEFSMTDKRRTALAIIVPGLLITGLAVSAINVWLPPLVQHWLPEGTRLSLSGHFRPHAASLSFPGIALQAGDCQAVSVNGLSVGYRDHLWQWHATSVRLDTGCLAAVSSSSSTAPEKTLAEWQALLPAGHWQADKLEILPWGQYAGRMSLTNQHQRQSLTYDSPDIQLSAVLDGRTLNIRRLQFTPPGGTPPLTLQGTVGLAPQVGQWPEQGQLDGQLSLTGLPLHLDLHWQQQQGVLTVLTPENTVPLLQLPWTATPQQLEIQQGKWQWPFASQPLQGGIALQVAHWREGLENSVISGRLNALTSGHGGKGNVVLSLGPGKLSLTDSALPLRLTGTANSPDLQFFAGLPAQLTGPLAAPEIRFLSGALLRMRGQLLNTFQVDEARWPLAGVHLSAAGINGPLQAILQVHNRTSGRYRLQLAGQARDFWPDQGQWQWRYWGSGELLPLKAAWDLQGTGDWHGPQITLKTLSTGFNQLSYGGVRVVSPRLILTSPLIWRRQADTAKLTGAFALTAGNTLFSYGGRLPALHLPFSVSGTSPRDFLYQARLTAGKLGPLALRGRWDGDRLRGEAWWASQPLAVVEPLLPPDMKMKITGGTMRAQVAFSASAASGFRAGGHWVINGGNAWTPDNQIQGAGFSLPFRYQQQRWQLGYHQPVRLTIDRIVNQIGLSEVTASLQGSYPWSQDKPLRLSDVSMSVSGGRLSLAELRLPQRQAALLKADKIDLSRLITALHPGKIAMSGRVSGELPLWVSDPHYIIRDGWVSNDGPLTLRVDKDMIDSITSNNMAAGVAVDWLRYMEIGRAQARLQLNSDGELTMKSTVQGTSRFSNHDQRVNLNYTHQENIFRLWESLNFGSNLESLLSQQLKYPRAEGNNNEKR